MAETSTAARLLSWLRRATPFCFASAAALAGPLGLPVLPIPADNPPSAAKIRLGDRLFHDQRLSSTGQIACASCHLDVLAFHDGRPVSRGVHMARGTRNAPTVVNAAFQQLQFWDGRAASLEQQASQPLFNPLEHGLRSEAELLQRIRGDGAYAALFREAFQIAPQDIGLPHVAKAIAAFERTLIAGDSPFDRWRYGGDARALSESAQRGLSVFAGAGNCITCHPIAPQHALFTDQAFHNINVGFFRLGGDAGRIAGVYLQAADGPTQRGVLGDQQLSELGRFAVSHRREDIGAFKTPGLRNVARTAPYMHDGSLNTLEDVVDYFDSGGALAPGGTAGNPFLSPLLHPLHLSAQQKQDLVAFLQSLTSPAYTVPGRP